MAWVSNTRIQNLYCYYLKICPPQNYIKLFSLDWAIMCSKITYLITLFRIIYQFHFSIWGCQQTLNVPWQHKLGFIKKPRSGAYTTRDASKNTLHKMQILLGQPDYFQLSFFVNNILASYYNFLRRLCIT